MKKIFLLILCVLLVAIFLAYLTHIVEINKLEEKVFTPKTEEKHTQNKINTTNYKIELPADYFDKPKNSENQSDQIDQSETLPQQNQITTETSQKFQFNFDSVTEIPESIILKVPFSSQAPHGNWEMPYQEACEETSLIMVKYYLSGETLNKYQADNEIKKIVQWEEENGYLPDIDAMQTLAVGKHFYNIDGEIFYDDDVTLENIKKLLAKSYPVIIPAAGRILANPNYSGEGPEYHMIVIIGYDKNGFITHDPGTRHGENYQYSYETIYNAIHDWIGSKDTIIQGRKSMLILYSN